MRASVVLHAVSHAVPSDGARRHAAPAPRFHALDLVRFAAALSVVLFHYAFRGAAGGEGLSPVHCDAVGRVARYGYLGVHLFFVVSGYVIALSAEGRSAGAFVRARARRLYPAFWICCLTTAAVAWASGLPAFAVTGPELLANLTLGRVAVGSVSHGLVDGAYWSLQVELRFYAAVAAVLLWTRGDVGRTRRGLFALTAGWTALALADLAGVFPGRHGFLWLPYAPLFAAGVAYAALARARVAGAPNGRGALGAWAMLAVAVPLSVALAVREAAASAAHYHATFSPAVVAAVLLVGHAGFALATARGWDVRPSALWPVLGAVTYPLYLLHQHIGYVVLTRSAGHVPPGVALAGLVVGAVGAALAVARWGEPRVLGVFDRELDALAVARRAVVRPATRPVTRPAVPGARLTPPVPAPVVGAL